MSIGMVCIRLIEHDDKGASLASAVAALANGNVPRDVHAASPESFKQVPRSPFAYWVSENVRKLFVAMPSFAEDETRLACITNPAGDDVRYFRCFWEVPTNLLGHEYRWASLAKGGEFSRYYADQHLVVDWDSRCESYRGFLGTVHRPLIRPASVAHFFRPGLTYSRRSQKGFSVRVLPANTIFHDKGPGIFSTRDEALALLGVFNSSFYSLLLSLQMAFGSYEVGVVQRTPMPRQLASKGQRIAELARLAWAEKRSIDTTHSTSHAFVVPALVVSGGATLADRSVVWDSRVSAVEASLDEIQAEIDDLTFRLYDLGDADRPAPTSAEVGIDADGSDGKTEIEEAETSPDHTDTSALTADAIAYCLGCVFGRWDIRYATGERPPPATPDPFAPLPVCPPGMLQGDDSLPLSPEEGRRLRAEGRYPLDVAWDGILVDDPENSLELERHVRAALSVLWGERADELEQEACAQLGVPTLREWFRRPAGFFADHLKRYSKSRRQAPIYWPISTASGRYTLWLYYHRLNAQTLYTCVTDFVKPKLITLTAEADGLQAGTQTGGTARERAELQELRDFQAELKEMRDELLRVAQLPWKPNLNDGVLITASPLWKLFRQPKWQKDLKACWEELAAGDYDWSRLALAIWPDRVREKCKTDRSLAIAHGLEDLCEIEAPKPKTKRAKKPGTEKPAETPDFQ
jgi:hypothetical protein